MESHSKEALPERVPFTAMPLGEPSTIDQWASRAVWTGRMLSTLLENRVKGGRWYSLIDKVYDGLNLYLSARKVTGKRGAAGVDGQTTDAFERHLIEETRQLGNQLRGGTYRPCAVRRVHIPKSSKRCCRSVSVDRSSVDKRWETRPLGIPTVRDRVVQTALVEVIEPILDHQFHERSFGFRHGRSAHDALRIVEQKLQEGYVYVVDADLQSYFDTIPKDGLMRLLREHISDSRLLQLVQMFLDQSILEELHEWTPVSGVPQGAVLSPVLSNLYLNGLDHEMADSGFEMVRYADDFVVLCRSRFEAEVALQTIVEWVSEAGLTLHPTKTKIVDVREQSFSFLGYSFRGKYIYPRRESLAKVKSRIGELTCRQQGESLAAIVKRINRTLMGWFGYFRYCRYTIFKDLDAKIRSRLRRLLLKRHRRNPQRLSRHQRWPNAFFTAVGLWSLREAHHRFGQSLLGNY